ncbi:hypothetical protein O998_06045 [Anaplasma phagocytophilum str. Norway variant1]|uniref:Uncharacterized protein n=1 Tax=Anaplasma phagocytophilum str. Norway variant1 TaxID=1392506 RepID=A0A7H9E062_ANAPH|nr:hypothetical protein [Anaplasma phagocytophilum]QLL67204.1 hypothetical protein O998_06045 [Anaplasma phagocytophilum str. Norway variant1]
MFDILDGFTIASVNVTCPEVDDCHCLKSCNGFSMDNLSLVRATPLEQNIDSEGEAYSMRFTSSSLDEAAHIQEKLLDIVVKKDETVEDLGIALVSASLHEILTSESILYIGDENTDAYAHERELYVSGLKETSKYKEGSNDNTIVITAKNNASGCTVNLTLNKAKAAEA